MCDGYSIFLFKMITILYSKCEYTWQRIKTFCDYIRTTDNWYCCFFALPPIVKHCHYHCYAPKISLILSKSKVVKICIVYVFSIFLLFIIKSKKQKRYAGSIILVWKNIENTNMGKYYDVLCTQQWEWWRAYNYFRPINVLVIKYPAMYRVQLCARNLVYSYFEWSIIVLVKC